MKYPRLSFLLFLFLLIESNVGFAQILTKLHDFDSTNGAFSRGNHLISDGTYFYSMTTFGGIYNKGVIYKIKTDGTGFQKLYDFDGLNGAEPYNSLTLINSQLYGTTFEGGIDNRGVIFRINTDGSNYTKLIEFTGNNGHLPQSSLTFDGSYLYGTTYAGGEGAGGGTIFKIKPDGTNFEIVHSFNASNNINGTQPHWDFLFDESNTYLYGTTFLGGINNKGVIYRIKTDGTNFEKLHDFDGLSGDYSGKLMMHDDYLYATTLRGGENEKGVIYKIKKDGTDFMKLYDFEQMTGTESIGSMTFMNEYLYGITISGGSSGGGAIFKIKPDGTEFTSLYTFNNDSGYSPWSSMYFDGEDFYGITQGGGIYGYGTVFKFDPDAVLSASEISSSQELAVFPNPAKDNLHLAMKGSIITDILVYDTAGKLVMKQTPNGNTVFTLDISHLKNGVYFIQSGNKTVKFIKQ